MTYESDLMIVILSKIFQNYFIYLFRPNHLGLVSLSVLDPDFVYKLEAIFIYSLRQSKQGI